MDRRSLFVAVSLIVGSYAQACQPTVLQSAPPTDDSHVAVSSYSYCGGNLNVTTYVRNDCYNKKVLAYYANSAGQSTPLTSLSLDYQSSVPNSAWEVWATSGTAWQDGVTKILNVTFQALDIGQTYDQVLDAKVTASGAPPPTLSQPPAPFVTPSGFGQDISSFVQVKKGSEPAIALSRMFLNIDPALPGAVDGVVVAGRSGPDFVSQVTNYEYDWVRDSSLTMDVVQQLYCAATNLTARKQYENTLFSYAAGRAVEQNDPNLQTGLGEPKFYLNNTIFSGPWGRPQNDGPATAAITLMDFAYSYIGKGGKLQDVRTKLYDSANYPSAPILKDLLFVASNWSSPSFDLWEEEESDHFYTRMVQRRALKAGVAFAKLFNDQKTAATLNSAYSAISATMPQFWNQGRQIVLYSYGPVLHGKTSFLDVSVILGLLHGYADDGVYSYTNDQVQSTAVRLATSFIPVYPVANATHTSKNGQPLGLPIGRYPEDVYSGLEIANYGGNPWYLTTAALAEYMYKAVSAYRSAGVVAPTNVSKVFFDYFAPTAKLQVGKSYQWWTPEYRQALSSLSGWGDAFMRTIQYYTPADGRLTEEFNRTTGAPQGCEDLTWSYASFLTASFARAEATGQWDYVSQVANLGFAPNK